MCLFHLKGLVQVAWSADARDTVNVLTIDDYFGELSLFANKKLSYTARSITYLDTFRLDRDDFMLVMRSHPAGAVHVTDLMESYYLQTPKQVTRDLRVQRLGELLQALQPGGKWRPPKGLAVRLKRFAVEHADALENPSARS